MPKQHIISDIERFSFLPPSMQHVFSLTEVKLLRIYTVEKVKLFLIQKAKNAVLRLSATLNFLLHSQILAFSYSHVQFYYHEKQLKKYPQSDIKEIQEEILQTSNKGCKQKRWSQLSFFPLSMISPISDLKLLQHKKTPHKEIFNQVSKPRYSERQAAETDRKSRPLLLATTHLSARLNLSWNHSHSMKESQQP